MWDKIERDSGQVNCWWIKIAAMISLFLYNFLCFVPTVSTLATETSVLHFTHIILTGSTARLKSAFFLRFRLKPRVQAALFTCRTYPRLTWLTDQGWKAQNGRIPGFESFRCIQAPSCINCLWAVHVKGFFFLDKCFGVMSEILHEKNHLILVGISFHWYFQQSRIDELPLDCHSDLCLSQTLIWESRAPKRLNCPSLSAEPCCNG